MNKIKTIISRYFSIIRYALKKDLLLIILAILILLVAINYFIRRHDQQIEISTWTNVVDPIITLLTVSITLLVYLSNAKRDWENNLEKRLTVHFELHGKYIMTCHEAYLSNESDIRAWGQTIGSQMTKKTNLEFYPFISGGNQTKIIHYDINLNKEYKLYEVTFHLINIIDQIKPDKQPDLETKYLVWWENNDKSHGNKAVYFDEQPLLPKSIEEAIIELEKQTQNKC